MKPIRRVTGKDVLWGFIAFFALIFAANATLVFLAMDSWTGLETEQSYSKGLAYNRILDADLRQRALGWHGSVVATSLPEGRARVHVGMSDKGGGALDGLVVTANFIRPTHHGHDFIQVLRAVGGGSYEAEFALPLQGQWDVRILASRGNKTFVLQDRVVLK